MCANVSCHPSRVTNRSRRGSSTTQLAQEGQPLGRHDPAVLRPVGQADNCQVAVILSVATHQGSLPVAYRLYLPKDWADDAARRAIAGVPDEVCFRTQPEIALQLLRHVLVDGVPPAPVLMDPAYGNDSKLRTGISELGLTYVAGILPTTMVWRPGEAPLPPASRAGRGRPRTRLRRDETHRPVAAKTLALELAADAWQQITWRDGRNTPLTSRFARWRVRPAHDDARRSEPAAEEWLLIEWPEDAAERTITGSPRCRPTSRSNAWSIRRNCAGEFGAIISNSSRRSASATMKAAVGEAFTITQLSALPLTDS